LALPNQWIGKVIIVLPGLDCCVSRSYRSDELHSENLSVGRLLLRNSHRYYATMEVPDQNPTIDSTPFTDLLANPFAVLALFEYLPEIYMYVKDRDGRYIHVNRVAREVMGIKHASEAVGKNDFDFFPPAVAAQYIEEDRRVVESAKPLTNQVWLVPGKTGVPHWYLCNKIPLLDRQGSVVGLAGVKRLYEHAGTAPSGYARLLKVVEYVTENFSQAIEVSTLAELVELSVSQLQREFGRLFGITPVQYIREVRVGVARHLLETSSQALTNIAVQCGFYDQSHFTRQFKASTGLTPHDYRRRFGV
jgi:AraC-like DNA-binding protein